MNPPLQGIRVLDFGRYIAGPYCAMMLADMGADVIRVDRRGGSEDRYLGPVSSSGEGGLFLSINRNKRSITLDPSKPQAAEVVRRLAAGADIVVANLPLPVLEKMGIDYDALQSIKPDIILVMASTFGPDGPYAQRVGFDTIAQAMSGAMSLTGFPGPPTRAVVTFADYGTALHAAFGALAALYQRQQTGQGQLVDASLLATAVTFMQPLLAERYVTGIERQQQGNTGYWSAPSDTYHTRDGWIVIAVVGKPMFERWAKVIGRPDLLEDPRLATDIGRADHHDVINQAMDDWCQQRTTEQAIAELEQARIPSGPVLGLEDVIEDPQVQARQLLSFVPYPGAPKDVPLANTPVRLSGSETRLRRAPTLGEHTEEVLTELGFTSDEIASLRQAEAV